MSDRGNDWSRFSADVLRHIEEYVIPQYGDKGEDLASSWPTKILLEQAKKYIDCHGRNIRPGHEIQDLRKAAHYIQMAATQIQEELDVKNCTCLKDHPDYCRVHTA